METLTLAAARRVWAHRQFPDDARLPDVPGGWCRSLGGTDPYLAMKARCPAIKRAEVDTALLRDVVYVGPGVRGCIWLMRRKDVSLALRIADSQYRKKTLRDMAKLGVADGELERLGEAILGQLQEEKRSPELLRELLGERILRLGEAGKKVGHSTTLPAALRLLEADGHIARHQESGQLDTNRYQWGIASPNLLTLGTVADDEAGRNAQLAAHYLEWAAPATVAEFVAWSTLGKRAAAAAFAALDTAQVQIEGYDQPAFVLAEQAQDLMAAADREDSRVHLIPSTDNMLTLRGDPMMLADPAHAKLSLLAMGNRTVSLDKARWVHERLIIYQGRWIGVWAWDFEAQVVVLGYFSDPGRDVRAEAQRSAEALRPFIAHELEGRARCNAVDGEAGQRRRIASVRQYA